MLPNLTWENIHLDHARPLSSFDLSKSDQLKEASHYSNIQPLLKKDNLIKGDKYNEHDLIVHRERVYEYLTFCAFRSDK